MCKTVGCAIIVVQALSGCACVSQGVVRVGTYNIRLAGEHVRLRDGRNYWDNRKRDLVSLVRRMDLDVFGLQEVTLEQASYLRENLCDYSFVGEHRNSDRITGEASPVCYRKSRFRELDKGTFWLSETPDKPGSVSAGLLLSDLAGEVDGSEVLLCECAHGPFLQTGLRAGVVARCSEDAGNRKRRADCLRRRP